jgi:hypothetical protein
VAIIGVTSLMASAAALSVSRRAPRPATTPE